jgi:hypothetical protein
VFTVLLGALLLPLFVLLDWSSFIKRRAGTLEGELAKASHGAALVCLSAGGGYFLYLQHALNPWALGALLVTGVFGAGWLSTGYALVPPMQAAHRARFIGRAFVKIGVGAVAGFLLWREFTSQAVIQLYLNAQLFPGAGLLVFLLAPLSVWCIVTGLAKIPLVMKGDRKSKAPPVTLNPHGSGRAARRGESRASGNKSRMDGVKF